MDAVNVAVRIEEVVVVFVVVLSSSHVWLFSTRGLQHSRLPCPSLSPGVCSSSCPLHRWCHTTISSSATPFSFCLLSFPASGSFPMSHLFTSCSQSIGASASARVGPGNIQGWFSLEWRVLITWCEELTHWKRPWCWEGLKVKREEGGRGWDG